MSGLSSFPPLRNNSVRDESPARQRLGSFKRKPDGSISYANAASSSFQYGHLATSGLSSEKLEELTVDITKVNSLCDKIDTAFTGIADENVKNVLVDVSAAIKLLNINHEGIVKIHTNKATHPAVSNGMASLGNISKRNRIQSTTSVPVPVSVQVPAPSPAYDSSSVSMGSVSSHYQSADSNPELKVFKDAVTKAESSTLVFNLDLGRIPIMNTETMSTRATLALAAMAADTENRPGSIPTDETVSFF
jgi:hypothetical protein